MTAGTWCSCEQPVSRYGRVCEACGGYLEGVQVRRIEGDEHAAVMADWHTCDRPRRVVDPEQDERGDTAGAQSIPPGDQS